MLGPNAKGDSTAPAGIRKEQFVEAARKVAAATKILVLSHWRPDGDAIGCVVALREVLRGLGKDVTAGLPDDVPGRYRLLERAEPIPNITHKSQQAAFDDADLLIIVDTAAWSQVQPIAGRIKKCRAPRLIVDHHTTADVEAEMQLIDTSAGAASIVLLDWFAAAGWELNKTAAEALFVALATDCGWFRHANTDARMLRAAANLIDRWAIDGAQLYRDLYMDSSKGRIRLMAAMLDTLELHAADQLAVCHITQQMFDRAAPQYWETEELITEPQRIGSVQVAALLVEEPDGKIRISLRSKDATDVAQIAQQFNGGGHVHAAATVEGELMPVKKQLVDLLSRQMASA